MSKICIVLPTYNEVANLPKLIGEIESILTKDELKIVVVDDNSPDGTSEIAEKLNTQYGNIIVHRRPGKLGIGSAILDGMKIALSFPDTQLIVTMDADFSHDPKYIPRLLSAAEKVDFVQGSRYIKGGKIIGWSRFRRLESFAANTLCNLLLRTHIKEHTTYFRVYSRRCADAIVKNALSKKFEFAIESILIAKDHNFTIKEVPITFINRAYGKSKLKISDVFWWFFYLMKAFLLRLSEKQGLKQLR